MKIKKCKLCENDLIGKEKFFCRNCCLKIRDKSKRGAGILGSIFGVGLLAYLNKDKIEDFFDGDSGDI